MSEFKDGDVIVGPVAKGPDSDGKFCFQPECAYFSSGTGCSICHARIPEGEAEIRFRRLSLPFAEFIR